MKDIKSINVIPLEQDKFKLYGEILKPHMNLELDFGEGTPTMRIFSAPFREFMFDEMSRHLHCCQVFLPLNGKDFIIALAPPSDNNDPFAVPDIKRIRAFIVNGSSGIVLHKGCWHVTPFPFCYKSHIATMHCKNTFEEDLDIKKLDINFRILFE